MLQLMRPTWPRGRLLGDDWLTRMNESGRRISRPSAGTGHHPPAVDFNIFRSRAPASALSDVFRGTIKHQIRECASLCIKVTHRNAAHAHDCVAISASSAGKPCLNFALREQIPNRTVCPPDIRGVLKRNLEGSPSRCGFCVDGFFKVGDCRVHKNPSKDSAFCCLSFDSILRNFCNVANALALNHDSIKQV
jgi:hypothetical protein